MSVIANNCSSGFQASGHRVLIYSQFVIMLDILEEYLVGRNWGFQRIDGQVGKALIGRR